MIIAEDDYIDFHDTDWFKEVEADLIPASNLAFYRKLENLTQKELAEKLGTTNHVISDMENGRKAISKNMARKLAACLSVPVARFI